MLDQTKLDQFFALEGRQKAMQIKKLREEGNKPLANELQALWKAKVIPHYEVKPWEQAKYDFMRATLPDREEFMIDGYHCYRSKDNGTVAMVNIEKNVCVQRPGSIKKVEDMSDKEIDKLGW